ncbi:metal-sulfur cluster biosynthetic enzyme [Intrasporangium oryzae NRRL B-24470]|uniref:Metal-sulfur cluster biosynthetic enzyme n=1 Tax=Intrasporangium oryzae NRRL B-24470 TaxID=1386089 RepID=W9GBD9_9MICO|nr:iron-sulfur cluster assembly protein [Intrasporangium oryzae]EWT01184.1 metal-sulfur cluster biosynthetic enzyme [Intrasporangium oryzae NRRL B-24470]
MSAVATPVVSPAPRDRASARRGASLANDVIEALTTVKDPELDEPITELGFVRSVALHPSGVTVHLRLPTSFCAPNFAYLMVSDAQDALRRVPGAARVTVLLDDHHDSDKINAGIAADAGYLGTFGAEAAESLDALRLTFQRKAHTAAMERCVMAALTSGAARLEDLGSLTLGDLAGGPTKEALLRRRADIGLGLAPGDLVVVDEHGDAVPDEELPLRLRLATSVRISIEGNAHFCRGLLATRYANGDSDAITTDITDTRSTS